MAKKDMLSDIPIKSYKKREIKKSAASLPYKKGILPSLKKSISGKQKTIGAGILKIAVMKIPNDKV
uniref:hypothetical protein n=1 Tax=Pedobacter schmidteae TaxID=2201271 RepID=UPI001D01C7B1|nr:hypothetical protein [Pedobacter schmidteae]